VYFEFGQSLVWIADATAAMQESATAGVANTASMLESMRAMQEGEEEEEEEEGQAPQLRLQEEEAQKTQVHLNSSDYPMLCLFAG